MMDNHQMGQTVGFIMKWLVCIGLGLLAMNFLFWLAGPVIEQASKVFDSIGSAGGFSGDDSIYGLAVLSIIIIGIVGAIKAFRK